MPDVLDTLVDLLGPAFERRKSRQFGLSEKHDITGVPSAVGYAHGPGGLLSFPGVDPAVFSAIMGSQSIIGQIPSMPSRFTNPTYFTLTGVTAESGNEMSDICDDAPEAGLMQGCLTTSVFGRYERATQKIDVGRLGEQTDRADPMDLTLVNSPFGNVGPIFGPPTNPGAGNDILTNEVNKRLWERAVTLYRLLARQVWLGNPTNNLAGGGYKEMTGLQLLVNTGYKDAETGVACRNMDSYISSFNYASVNAAGNSIVDAITNMYHQVRARAEMANIMPVRWVIAMRRDLFYEITKIWPCNYLTVGCLSPTILALDPQDAVRFRDEMRAGKYLLMDGDRIDVVIDDAIPELSGNDSGGHFPRGCFSSDVYMLPMSVVGGRSVLYTEYFQFNNESANAALGNMVLGRVEGPWLTWPRQTNMCVQWQSRIEPRLVLRTPWLAARLQNVVYCPIQHTPEPFTNEPYFVGDGKTSRSGPSFSNLWS